MIIVAGTVVVAGRAPGRGWVETRGDRIAAVGSGTPTGRPDVDLPDATVVPGFVDMHVHGGGGGSFTGGDVEEISRALDFHRAHGTTTCLASLVTAGRDDLRRAVGVLADLVADGLLGGIHLEGPWLNPVRGGAHDRHQLRAPDGREIDELLLAGRGAIRMVTLAPELDGGLDAVRRLAEAGVTVAVGHTDASYDLTRRAIAAGARVGTHLFNAMRPVHHREPGPALALLEDPRVTVEIVGDGVHVHPALQRHVISAAGPARVALVTDAMAAAGMPDGCYRLGPLEVTVTAGSARLPGTGTIAGSTATMDELFRRGTQASGLPRSAAVTAAAEMTASTPARALGLIDVGDLRPGHRADLVVLDAACRVTAVMAGGRWTSVDGTSAAGALRSTGNDPLP